MKNAVRTVAAVALVAQAGLLASTASAQVTWTSSVAPSPAYANTLNFDEAPLPATVPGLIAGNEYVSRGVTSITSGGGVAVTNGNTYSGWTFFPSGNQALATSYIDIQFAYNLTSFSAQFWESASNGGPFGGGARIDLFDNGNQVGSLFITNPFWASNVGQAVPTWFNAVATGGVVFDQIIFQGFSSTLSDTAAIDNLSWVPSPGAAALLGMGGLFAGRRRR